VQCFQRRRRGSLDRDRLALGPAEDRGIFFVPFGLVELAQAAVAAAYLVGIKPRER
jgi:hypothetical protein